VEIFWRRRGCDDKKTPVTLIINTLTCEMKVLNVEIKNYEVNESIE
jgi:hypothetical protein